MNIVRYWKGEEDRYVPGVPARDISEEEWQQLPEQLRREADSSGLYRKSPPAQKPEKKEE